MGYCRRDPLTHYATVYHLASPASCTLHIGSSSSPTSCYWQQNLTILKTRWHRWAWIGAVNPLVSTPEKTQNLLKEITITYNFFPKPPRNPDRTSSKCDKDGLKYISLIVIVMPHGLIRSAGCLSAICSLPKASTCLFVFISSNTVSSMTGRIYFLLPKRGKIIGENKDKYFKVQRKC